MKKSNDIKNMKHQTTFSRNDGNHFNISFEYKNVIHLKSYKKNCIPYIMHPYFYFKDHEIGTSKSFAVLLAGNFDEKIYTKKITDDFGVLDRISIKQSIMKFNEAILISGDQLISSIRKRNEFHNKIFVVDKKIGGIKGKDWLYCLSSAKFLVCPPGVIMPLCHNVIEALSVGTIPILNYSNWLNPSLEHNVNCLIFKSQEDLSEVIHFALTMSQESYNRLCLNVKNYYESYYANFDFASPDLIMINERLEDLV